MSSPKPRPKAVVFTFADGTKHTVPIEEVKRQHTAESARMATSESEQFALLGEVRLREAGLGPLADIAAETRKSRAKKKAMSETNKRNAEGPREKRVDPEDEIRSQFERLTREGHTPREARGLLLSWGKWSQSTIYRRTKEEN